MKKRIIVGLVILTCILNLAMVAAPFAFLNFMFSKEKEYYSKSGWRLTREQFGERFYPFADKFFSEKFEKIDIYKENERIDDSHYRNLFTNKDLNINIEYLVENSFCRFTFELFVYGNSASEYSFSKIEQIDKIITEFGLMYFYDYEIEDGIILDLYDENSLYESNSVYYDSGVGQLSAHYKRFLEPVTIDGKNEIFYFVIRVLLNGDFD